MLSTSALIRVAFVACMLAGSACEHTRHFNETSQPPPSAAGSGGIHQSWHASISVPDTYVGDENHVCAVLTLNNPSPIWVNGLKTTMSAGGHHLVIERMPAESQPTEAPSPCDATGGLDETRLFLALQPTSAMTLPPGVAYRLEANQHVIRVLPASVRELS